MNAEDLANLIIFGSIGGLFLVERLAPRQKFPKLRFWTVRGVLVSAVAFYLAGVLPFVWDETLAAYQLFDMKWLGHIGGAVAGMFFLELLNYGWHRALHGSDFLWKWSHQMHHSAERIDVPSALYFSPVDMVGWTAIGSLALVLILGITPEAALIANVALFVLNMFSHSNIKTPRWLGYLIARPEYHSLHHERGVHARNYATLTIWDQVFGTFHNPETFEGEVGFYDGASARIPEMLMGRDVTEPTSPSPSPSPSPVA